MRFKGAEGVKRSKSKAQKLLKGIAKALEKGRAFFPFDAACHSEDEDTAGCGGGLAGDDLRERFLPALPDLAPGAVSSVLESPRGLHLVTRCVCPTTRTPTTSSPLTRSRGRPAVVDGMPAKRNVVQARGEEEVL